MKRIKILKFKDGDYSYNKNTGVLSTFETVDIEDRTVTEMNIEQDPDRRAGKG